MFQKGVTKGFYVSLSCRLDDAHFNICEHLSLQLRHMKSPFPILQQGGAVGANTTLPGQAWRWLRFRLPD
jgi:hypothetical protein